MVSFRSDSATALCGKTSGVGPQLQEKFPKIVLWHCLRHRLELAVNDALQTVGGGENHFCIFVNKLHNLYSVSPKNWNQLQKCAKALATELKNIGHIIDVRWVSFSFHCVESVWCSYSASYAHCNA